MRTGNPNGIPVSLNCVLNNVHRVVQTSSVDEVWATSCSASPRSVQKGDIFFLVDHEAYGSAEDTLIFSDGTYYLQSSDDSDDDDEDECLFQPDGNGFKAKSINFFKSSRSAQPEQSKKFSIEESIAIAILRGCKAIVSEQPLTGLTVPTFTVPNVQESFGAYSHAVHGNPSQTLKVIGITGTSGKTSTSYLIAGMLAESGNPVGLIGSLGIYDGQKMHPSRDETLPANELAFWLAKMVENGCSHVILEVSSRSIGQCRLAGIQLEAVCITNIRRNHLDYHKTVESYRRTKMNIFRYAKRDALAVCNIDDPVTNAIIPLIDHPVLTTGIRSISDISATSLEINRGDQTFLVNAGSDVIPVHTRMIGNDHIYNSLTAIALGVGLGIDLKQAARGVERVENVPGRLERIDCGQPFGVFVDCAQTQDSLAGSLKTLRSVTSGRIFCVMGAGNDLDASRRPLLGRTMELYSDIGVVTRDEIQDGNDAEAMEQLLGGYVKAEKARLILNRAEAIAWVLSNAEPNDAVLIVGRGISEQQIGGARKKGVFCDRVFTKRWLYDNQPCLNSAGIF